ncbi:MAG: hypothetical protein ACRCVT_16475 [Leadbetterella sp.]
MKDFQIKYQSSSLVPPPYAFAVEFYLQDDSYQYILEYIDRIDLSQEEIEEEGFTGNDDLKFEGKLPEIWISSIEKMAKSTLHNPLDEIPEDVAFLLIQNQAQTLFPKEIESWESLLEELKQAILELHNVEAPMEFQVLRIDGSNKRRYEITAQFAQKKLSFTDLTQSKNIAWESLNEFLRDFCSSEMIYEKSSSKEPSKSGIFVEYGDGQWYEVGHSLLVKPSQITKWLQL